MSTRFDGESLSDTPELDFGRWKAHRKAAIEGKPGQSALRSLEAALLAMPRKELIAGTLCDGQTGVCSMGAWVYRHWVDEEGMTPKAAWKRLQSENKRAGSDWDQGENWDWEYQDELDRTIDVGVRELGITQTLAEAVAEVNDERAGWRIAPAERYQRVLSWVQARIETGRADNIRYI